MVDANNNEISVAQALADAKQTTNRAENLAIWAEYLRENPSDDFQSVMELQVPMSVQVEIMRKAEEMDVTNLDIILLALSTYGLPVENHL